MSRSAPFDPARPFVVYVGPFAFPEGGAAARRILGNAQSLVAAGYQVLVLSGQQAPDDEVHSLGDGIFVASTSERDAEHLPNLLRLTRYVTMGAKSRHWLERLDARPAAVILYSGYTPYILQLRGWCRRAGVPLIFDAVEWYTAASPLGFATSPYLWQTEIAMRWLIPRLDGVIAISRWLENHYTRAGLPVVRVPPTLDTLAVSTSLPPSGPVKQLVYAGSLGTRKDMLGTIIEAMHDLNGVELVVLGPTHQEYCRTFGISETSDIPPFVRFLGQKTHAEAQAIIRASDYTIFVRPVSRLTSAGFPTKFVESLALGVPVITNLTSDLGEVHVEGQTGFVAESESLADVARAIESAVEASTEQRQSMRANCLGVAQSIFDIRQYALTMEDIVTRGRLGTSART